MAGVILLTLSCADHDPVGPVIEFDETAPVVSAASNGPAPVRLRADPLFVGDMLGDPLFRALVQGVAEPDLADPLNEAIDALEAEQLQRATTLLARAVAEAEALADAPDTDGDLLVAWSVIERYLDAAELI